MMKQQLNKVWIYLFFLVIFNVVNSMEINQYTLNLMLNNRQNETQEKLKKYCPFYKEIMVEFPHCDDKNDCQIGLTVGMAAAITNCVLTSLMNNPVFPNIGYFIGILQVSLRSTYNRKSAIFFMILNTVLYVVGRYTPEIYGQGEFDTGEFIDSQSNRMFWLASSQISAEYVRHSRISWAPLMRARGESDEKACNKYILPLIAITNSIMPIFQIPEFFGILLPLSILQTVDPENAILLLFVNIHAILTFGAETNGIKIVTSAAMALWFGFLQIAFVKYRNKVIAKNTTNSLLNV